MARFGGTNDVPEPEEVTPPVAAPPAPPVEAPSELSDDDLREVITAMGFDYDALPEDDREFVRESEINRRAREHERGQLEAPAAPSGEAHPLIPTSDDELETPSPPPGAPSTDDGEEAHGQHQPLGEGGVPAPSSGEEGEPVGSPVTPPPTDSFVIRTDQGEVALPRETVEQAVLFASSLTQEEVSTLNAIRQGVMTPVFVDPQTRQPQVPNQPVAQPEPWVDEQAQSAFQTVETQLQALTAEQEQIRDILMARQQQEMISAMDGGIERFAKSHGFAITDGTPDDQLQKLLQRAEAMNILPVFGAQYPGDPGTAIEKALDAVYWSIPEYRALHDQTLISEHHEATRSVEEKKEANASISTTPGSAPRESTPTYQRGMTREEQVSRMADFIANARTPV